MELIRLNRFGTNTSVSGQIPLSLRFCSQFIVFVQVVFPLKINMGIFIDFRVDALISYTLTHVPHTPAVTTRGTCSKGAGDAAIDTLVA